MWGDGGNVPGLIEIFNDRATGTLVTTDPYDGFYIRLVRD